MLVQPDENDAKKVQVTKPDLECNRGSIYENTSFLPASACSVTRPGESHQGCRMENLFLYFDVNC